MTHWPKMLDPGLDPRRSAGGANARPCGARLRAAVPLLQGLSRSPGVPSRHWLWEQGRYGLAAHLQNRISEAFGVDVHPAARIGSGVLIDHGTSVVIGETAVVEDNVSLLHEVTLGGTGKETGDRHPKVRRGVLIGAGAKILGNIEIGIGAKVAACSVVLKDVPPHTTVAGIPARVVGDAPLPSRHWKWTRRFRFYRGRSEYLNRCLRIIHFGKRKLGRLARRFSSRRLSSRWIASTSPR